MISKRHRQLTTAALAVLSTLCNAAPQLTGVEPLRLEAPNGVLTLQFSEPVKADQLFVTVAPLGASSSHIDVSALLEVSGSTVTINFVFAPLTPGAHELRIYTLALNGTMSTMGYAVFDIAAEANPVPSESRGKFKVKLDVSVATQAIENVGGSQKPSARPRFADLNAQGQLNAEQSGDDWELRAQMQLVGSSYRQSAASFGKLRERAPKLDVKSYVVDGGWRDTRFNLGHIQVDTNPLLYTGISNRGFALQHKLPFGFDLGIAVQNGSPLFGYRDLVGLSTYSNQHRTIGLGYDFLSSNPGQFRVDFTFADSRIRLPFSRSSEPDASRGHGARLLWRNDAGTLRTETVIARSNFQPPAGSIMADDVSGRAGTFEAGYDIIKDRKLSERLDLGFTVAARSEYASPSYRSLGSYFSANYRMDVLTGTLKLGPAQAQLQGVRRYDNLDRDRTFLRNRVDASAFNLSLPLGSFLQDSLGKASLPAGVTPPPPSPWWPTLSVLQQLTHGFGDRDFIPLGYGTEDLPDVFIVNRAYGLAWTFETITLNLRTHRTDQNNRQPGATAQSTYDKRHSMSIDWRPMKTLSLSLGYDPSLNYRFDSNVRSDARQLRGSASWRPDDRWQIVANANHSADYDSSDTRYNRQNTSQLQLSRRFSILGPDRRKLPGQAYLRWSDTRGFNVSAGAPALEPSVRRLQFGLTISVF